MKKFITVLISLFIISSCLLPAYASGDVHVANSYTHYNENMHSYKCTICNVLITDYHSYDIYGNCDCGYFKHSHKVKDYRFYNENRHTYECLYCDVLLTDYHNFDIEGKCDCGYFRHGHEIGTYTHYNENMHSYRCKNCDVLITEYHNFDINGECDCGYFQHPQEPVIEESFCDILLSFLMWLFNLIISLF